MTEISTKERRRIYEEEKAKQNQSRKGPFIILAILVAVLAFLIFRQRDNISFSDLKTIMPSTEAAVVTMDEYQRIIVGMTYQEVVGVIGQGGEEASRNIIAGVPGVMDAVETIMYQWQNRNGSNMNAIFQNDKLMQKAQFGLK